MPMLDPQTLIKTHGTADANLEAFFLSQHFGDYGPEFKSSLLQMMGICLHWIDWYGELKPLRIRSWACAYTQTGTPFLYPLLPERGPRELCVTTLSGGERCILPAELAGIILSGMALQHMHSRYEAIGMTEDQAEELLEMNQDLTDSARDMAAKLDLVREVFKLFD